MARDTVPFKRKLLVDARFQLKTIFTAIIISSVIFILIMAILLFRLSQHVGRIDSTIDSLKGSIETENNIVDAFIEYSRHSGMGAVMLSKTNVVTDHRRSMDSVERNIDLLKSLNGEFRLLFAIMGGLFIVHIIVFGLYLLRVTRRTSGPALVINRYLQAMLEDREPEARQLRKHDQLKEIYDKVQALYAKTQVGGGEKKAVKKPGPKKKAGDRKKV